MIYYFLNVVKLIEKMCRVNFITLLLLLLLLL